MASYPIWMDISSCIYKSSKSYGIKREGKTNIYVGTSPKNSHHFGEIVITHRNFDKEGKSFRLYLDGKMIREGMVKDGELVLKKNDEIESKTHSETNACKSI